MSQDFIQSSWAKPDVTFEVPLRPQSLDDFVGQSSVRERLKIYIDAAKKREEPLGHILFCGPPGLGKTTLAQIMAKSMQSNIVITSGPALEKAGDLAGLLTNLKKGDVFFIDEIHRLPKAVEEYLYSAMEDFVLDLIIDTGPNARSVPLKLQPFTLVAATTRAGLLSSPLRSRFGMNLRLDYYEAKDLQKIIQRSSNLLSLPVAHDAALEIAQRSRGTPRIANNLLRWVRDFVQTKELKKIELNSAKSALKMLAIDERGLDEMDLKILTTIIDHHAGGPVGISTIAVAIGEEPSTIEEVYEPYLILQGFIKRTPRGREVTELGYQHLGRKKQVAPPKIKNGDSL
jgi:holliday junction DNA helicase RuvB